MRLAQANKKNQGTGINRWNVTALGLCVYKTEL